MLQLVSGGFLKSIAEDAAPALGGDLDGQSTHSLVNMVAGTFSGKGTFGSLAVGSTVLVANVTGYLGKVGFGTNQPTKHIDLVIPVATGAAGFIVRNTDGELRFVNGTSAANKFQPTYWGISKGSDRTSFLVGEIPAADDTGTTAAFTIDGRRHGAALQTRPILEIRNYGTTVCVVDKIGRFGIATTAGAAQVCIRQYRSTGTIPVLQLTQSDIDDTFVNYVGTAAADGSRSISTDTTENSAKFGAVRCEINGTIKWIRIYDDHS